MDPIRQAVAVAARSSGPALANAGSAKEKFPKLSSKIALPFSWDL
jgi:hypothetical protein